jgi:hypothetical protein
MDPDRRQFFQSLIAGGAAVRKTRKHVPHAADERLYHGPMQIPPHVYEAVREDPTPHRSTGRGGHLVSRYVDPDQTTWLFRCQIPAHRLMVGEIVRTPLSRIRVHCWSAADPQRCTRGDEPAAILANKLGLGFATDKPCVEEAPRPIADL